MSEPTKQVPQLHKDIQYIAVLAQIFGLLPVKGVLSNKLENITFSWSSKRVIISLIVISGSSFLSVTSLFIIFHLGCTLHRLSTFLMLDIIFLFTVFR